MSSTEIIQPALPRQAIQARGRTEPGRVTGKLKVALDLMVWECLKRPDAAVKAGMSDHGLREALRRPHVRAYYLSQIEVLRTSEKARNIQRLTEIRDAADNMPAVNAIKMLEDMGTDQQAKSNASVSLPGLTIQIINAPGLDAARVTTIESDARLTQQSEGDGE